MTIHDLPQNRDSLSSLATELHSAPKSSSSASSPPVKVHIHTSDIAHPSAPTNIVADTVEHLGPLHTMVANAGITQIKHCLDITRADMQRMFEVNVFAVHECFAAAARQFIRQGPPPGIPSTTDSQPDAQPSQSTATALPPHPPGAHGAPTTPVPSQGVYKLIGGASAASYKPFPGLAHYAAAKKAVRGLTHNFAQELAEHGITANSYAPGIVGTRMWEDIDAELSEMRGVPRGSIVADEVLRTVALGRVSVPEDVAGLVSFLAGPDSDYMTGQVVIVDGGIVYS